MLGLILNMHFLRLCLIILISPAISRFTFINPPAIMEIINPSESVPFSGTYQLDDTLNVTWTTNLTSYSINLRQQFPTDSDESTGELILLYSKSSHFPSYLEYSSNKSSELTFHC